MAALVEIASQALFKIHGQFVVRIRIGQLRGGYRVSVRQYKEESDTSAVEICRQTGK